MRRMNHLARLRPRTSTPRDSLPGAARPPAPAPRRPAGAIDPASIGLVLGGLTPITEVTVNGSPVAVDADGFVAIPRARDVPPSVGAAAEVNFASGHEVRTARVRLKSSPPRRLDVTSLPVSFVVGEPVPTSGPARVELVSFAAGTRVLVDGLEPAALAVDPVSGIYTVAVPSGGASVYVEQPPGAAGMSGPGELRLDLRPGEIIDLDAGDFPVVARRVPRSIDGHSGDVAETPAPTQPATPAPTQPATPAPTQPATPAPTQPATGSLEVRVLEAGARVSVDGEPIVGPPFVAELPAGRYTVLVEVPGRAPRLLGVEVVAGEEAVVEAPPAPATASGAWTAVAAVLAALGVVAAGAAVVAAVTRPKEEAGGAKSDSSW